MRNYPDEVVLMEIARAERRVQRSHAVTPNLRSSRTGKSALADCPVLRARWVLVDETLQLVWSEDYDEPLRRAA